MKLNKFCGYVQLYTASWQKNTENKQTVNATRSSTDYFIGIWLFDNKIGTRRMEKSRSKFLQGYKEGIVNVINIQQNKWWKKMAWCNGNRDVKIMVTAVAKNGWKQQIQSPVSTLSNVERRCNVCLTCV